MAEEKIITKAVKEEPTFGQLYIEEQKKDSGYASVKEIREGLSKDWDINMFQLIEKTRSILKTEKFYVCVTQKREAIASKTIRNYFESKYACPTPNFGQVVYRIPEHTHDWRLLWVLPDKESCDYLKKNASLLPSQERELLHYVIDFSEGKLDKLALIENGELLMPLSTH